MSLVACLHLIAITACSSYVLMQRGTNFPESWVQSRDYVRHKTAFSTFHIKGTKIQDAKIQNLIITI